jgi:hypothetical protein
MVGLRITRPCCLEQLGTVEEVRRSLRCVNALAFISPTDVLTLISGMTPWNTWLSCEGKEETCHYPVRDYASFS